MLEKNQAFPEFTLPDQQGNMHSLSDYAGKWLILYAYPRDNTKACSLEATDFSFMVDAFAAEHAVIIGVSPDSVKSHAGFTEKKALTVTLLSDENKDLLTSLGVWQKKKLYGKEHMGVVRSTFLVDPAGVVRDVWTKVKVPGHVEAVLEKLRELRKKD